jgi:hypothetical protein
MHNVIRTRARVKLPNGTDAIVERAKLVDYVLSQTHPIGRFKATFFASMGIDSENWEVLQSSLLSLAATADAKLGRTTEFGQKYLIPGHIVGPQDSADILSVWIIRAGEDRPRLVTVYPR